MTTKKRRSVVFKAEDLKYPTRDELKFADSKCPKFSNFDFKYKNELISILEGMSHDKALKGPNLFWWNIVLGNRFGSLKGAYYDALTHFRRGFAEDYHNCSDDEMVNRILFDSSVESFYYLFFVTANIIAHILNIFYTLKIEERKIDLNDNLIKKISNSNVKQILKQFLDRTSYAKDIRNHFTHKFPLNYPDYRAKYEETKSKITFHAGSGYYIRPSKLVEDIEKILIALSEMMEDLKKYVIAK